MLNEKLKSKNKGIKAKGKNGEGIEAKRHKGIKESQYLLTQTTLHAPVFLH
jgi:hypothetical protein